MDKHYGVDYHAQSRYYAGIFVPGYAGPGFGSVAVD